MGEVDKLIQDIESAKTAAKANLANTTRAFLRNLQDMPHVQELFALASDRTVAVRILDRLRRNSKMRIDPHYGNPLDTSHTIYLWVLQATHPDLARIGAEIVSSSRNIWWAEQKASEILAEQEKAASQSFSATSGEKATDWLRSTEVADHAFVVTMIKNILLRDRNAFFEDMESASGRVASENTTSPQDSWNTNVDDFTIPYRITKK